MGLRGHSPACRSMQLNSIVQKVSRTALRTSYERARCLSQEEQLRECIDLLENPELIMADIASTFEDIRQAFAQEELLPDDMANASKRLRQQHEEPRWFYQGRELSVHGGPYAFTCLSSQVEPLPVSSAGEPCQGLDYVGMRCDSSNAPVLGAVQSEVDTTAYPLLLRLVTCMAELAPRPQIDWMNAPLFMNTVPSTPSFDLTLITWEFQDDEERTPISQLTRDLAEIVKLSIQGLAQFPGILREIVCLRMNPDRFDARLRFDWRV